MKKILKLLKKFNKRNTPLHSIRIFSDESGRLYNEWDEEEIFRFDNLKELKKHLKNN